MQSDEEHYDNYVDNFARRNKFKAKKNREKSGRMEKTAQKFNSEFLRKFEFLKKLRDARELEDKLLDLIRFYERNDFFMHSRDVNRVLRRALPMLLYEKKICDRSVFYGFLCCLENTKTDHSSGVDLFLMSAMNRFEPGHLGEAATISKQRNSSAYLTFFLSQVAKARLMVHGRRVTQILWDEYSKQRITTLLYTKPESVLTLLRYEARLFSPCDDWDERSQELLAAAFEFILFCGVTIGHWTRHLTTAGNALSPSMKKMMLNFRYLLRAIPNPHYATYCLANTCIGSHAIPIPPIEKLRDFFNCVFPDCKFAVAKPASLLHFCKIAIRRQLSDNWQLPEGIYRLSLPTIIANYVDLAEE